MNKCPWKSRKFEQAWNQNCYKIAETLNWVLSGRLDELQRAILKGFSGTWTWS